ncbi:MAG: 2-hydroxy-3-oxopropionate reductase [Acidobacteria bacterium]|nr:MAG: 2-hydroxy-3-oxopropionate reductase [Acidobacteriota bacterium]
MSKERIGFIGLGVMGLPMAGHLLRAGYPLTVYNRTASKTADLASQGARVAKAPSGVAEQSDVVITMVSDSPDVEAVVAGPSGVIEGVRPGSVVIDMSTVAPLLEQRLDELLRGRGATLLDAPVSGGDVGARNATLAIMVGGDRTAFDRVRPILETMGKKLTHCGPAGSGQLTKLCNQILVSVNLLAMCEALLFAHRSGLDPMLVIDAVKEGAAGSWQLANLGPRVARRDFTPGFMIDLMQKDLRLIQENAGASSTPLPAVALVSQLLRSAQAHGGGREGTQGLAKVLEALAGV